VQFGAGVLNINQDDRYFCVQSSPHTEQTGLVTPLPQTVQTALQSAADRQCVGPWQKIAAGQTAAEGIKFKMATLTETD
jgi:hypothetical protein